MDANTQAELKEWTTLTQQTFLMECMCISAAALLFYDYILTLHLEIKLIWFSRWSYTKVLFLLIRYLTFLDTTLILSNRMDINRPEKWCIVSSSVALCLTALKRFLAEVILAVRTWAVWRRNKIVGAGLAAITLGNLVAQSIFTTDTVRAMELSSSTFENPPGADLVAGCSFPSLTGGFLPQNYAALTAVEAIVLALMVTSAFQSYRRGNSSELSHIIHRDGILFYVVLLCISAANVALPLTSTVIINDAMTLLTPLEEVLYSMLTCRIMLNIRVESRRNELHTTRSYVETSIVFAGRATRFVPQQHDDPENLQSRDDISDNCVIQLSSMGSLGADDNANSHHVDGAWVVADPGESGEIPSKVMLRSM